MNEIAADIECHKGVINQINDIPIRKMTYFLKVFLKHNMEDFFNDFLFYTSFYFSAKQAFLFLLVMKYFLNLKTINPNRQEKIHRFE